MPATLPSAEEFLATDHHDLPSAEDFLGQEEKAAEPGPDLSVDGFPLPAQPPPSLGADQSIFVPQNRLPSPEFNLDQELEDKARAEREWNRFKDLPPEVQAAEAQRPFVQAAAGKIAGVPLAVGSNMLQPFTQVPGLVGGLAQVGQNIASKQSEEMPFTLGMKRGEEKELPARLGSASGSAGSMIAGGPIAGAALAAKDAEMQASREAFGYAKQVLGYNDAEAQQYADKKGATAALVTLPQIAAFMGANKLVGAGMNLLPKNAPQLLKEAAGATTGIGGNVLGGGVSEGLGQLSRGEQFNPDFLSPENLLTAAAFYGHGRGTQHAPEPGPEPLRTTMPPGELAKLDKVVPAEAPAQAPTVPEKPETLQLQLDQLSAGKRPAVMITPGEQAPKVPEGMRRVTTESGATFIFDPQKLTAAQVREADATGNQNTILNLGPENKAAAMASGNPVAVTERTPAGEEVRAAVASPEQAPATAAEMAPQATPGNQIALEHPAEVLAKRIEAFREGDSPILVMEKGETAGKREKTLDSVDLGDGRRVLFDGDATTPEEAIKLAQQKPGEQGAPRETAANERGIGAPEGQRPAEEGGKLGGEVDTRAGTGAQDVPGVDALRGAPRGEEAAGASPVEHVVNFGRRVYKAGQTFVQWSGEMVRHLGENVRQYLREAWARIQGNERGGFKDVFGGVGKGKSMDQILRDFERREKAGKASVSEPIPDIKKAWVDPEGKIHMVPAGGIHENVAGKILGKDADLGTLARTDELLNKGWLRLQKSSEFGPDEGAMHVEARRDQPLSLTAAQRTKLADYAMTHGVDVIHDTRTGKNPTLFKSPPPIEEHAKEVIKRIDRGKAGGIFPNEGASVFEKAKAKQEEARAEAVRRDPREESFRALARDIPKAAKEIRGNYGAKDIIAAKSDAAENTAQIIGRRVGNRVALSLSTVRDDMTPAQQKAAKASDMLDRQALPFVIEGGNPQMLSQELQAAYDGATGKGRQILDKYAPIIKHAQDRFSELADKRDVHDEEMKRQSAYEKRAGVNKGEVENYVTRVLQSPGNEIEPLPFAMSGGANKTRYFVKGREFRTLLEAMSQGFEPATTDIATLDAHRVQAGQRLAKQFEFEEELGRMKTPDGSPLMEPPQTEPTKFDSQGRPMYEKDPSYQDVKTPDGNVISVHRDFAPLLKALFDPSSIRDSVAGRMFLKGEALLKHRTLVFDTFHGGRIAYKEIFYGSGNPLGYKRGLALLEYSPADIAKGVKAGEITPAEAEFAIKNHPAAKLLIENGLNVGRWADNLESLIKEHSGLGGKIRELPGKILHGFNEYIFQKLSRGAMMDAALSNLRAVRSAHPDWSPEQQARYVARETNQMFGNLKNQGIFKSKTWQDFNRLLFLAPQWFESQARSEVKAYGQVARGVGQALTGSPIKAWKGNRLGAGAIKGVGAMFLAAQAINLATRGQPTWQNQEDGRKVDAFLPIGKYGAWFSPYSTGLEMLHQSQNAFHRTGNVLESGLQMLGNKLSPIARSGQRLLTGKDYMGRRDESTLGRIGAAAGELVPIPIPLSPLVEKKPGHLPTLSAPRPGAIGRQLSSSVGFKLDTEQSPTSKVYGYARAYKSGGGEPPSDYGDVRRALQDENVPKAADALVDALQKRMKGLEVDGRTVKAKTLLDALKMTDNAMNLKMVNGEPTAKTPIFTRDQVTEKDMLENMNPEQMRNYKLALAENKQQVALYLQARRLAVQRLRSPGQ